jgi:3-deoxy-D-manno-octulosonic-acid transferase
VYLVYSLLLFFAILFYFPVYFFRIKIIKKEKLYLHERLGHGLPQSTPGEESIWIHAVSVGEVLSLQNLVKELKKRHPSWRIYFSSLTNAGLKIAKEKLKDADHVFFIPLDFARVVRRVLKILEPKMLVLAEAEFWPNLLRESHRQASGILLINGRMSQHAFKKYSHLKPLARGILKYIDLFLMQTDKDKEKLEKLGVEPDRVEIAGNLKSEVNLPCFADVEILAVKKNLGILQQKKAIVAGSTRKGEEKMLVEAYAEAKQKREDLLLILAPRHPERVHEVEKICQSYAFKIAKRTQTTPEMVWDILILDTIGDLARFYALSDVAFVGGSLVKWGGHNLLEPAFYGKPIFFGPHMENFRALAEEFVECRASKIVSKKEDLVDMFLLSDEKELEEMGKRAKELLHSLQGATEKTISAIEAIMARG